MRLIFAIFILLFSSSVWGGPSKRPPTADEINQCLSRKINCLKSVKKEHDGRCDYGRSHGYGEVWCKSLKEYYLSCEPWPQGWEKRCDGVDPDKWKEQQHPGLDLSQAGRNDPESDAFKDSLRGEEDDEKYTLIEAISEELTEQVRLLLDDDPDVNSPDDAGNTPLHWATFMWVSEDNSYLYVGWLLAFPEIEINAQNGAGMTALHEAAKLNRLGVVDRLLQYPGINARLLNYESETPLSLALKNDNDAIIQRLIDYFHDRYLAKDTLKESKYLWDWASSLLHQSGKLVLFADETITQTLKQSWNGWGQLFPEFTKDLEDWAQATGRVVAFTASKAADGTGYLARLTLGDSRTDSIIECFENTCQEIYENTTPEQRVFLSSVSYVVAGGVVGKIASRSVRAASQFPKKKIPKLANRGSTGRTTPRNLHEQLAMEQVMANPQAGEVLHNIKMGDKRWPAKEGWQKLSQRVKVESTGAEIEIHYLENTKTGMLDDFKLKD